jgi:hypothetical protein
MWERLSAAIFWRRLHCAVPAGAHIFIGLTDTDYPPAWQSVERRAAVC